MKGAAFWEWFSDGQVAPAAEGGGSGLYGIKTEDAIFGTIRQHAAAMKQCEAGVCRGTGLRLCLELDFAQLAFAVLTRALKVVQAMMLLLGNRAVHGDVGLPKGKYRPRAPDRCGNVRPSAQQGAELQVCAVSSTHGQCAGARLAAPLASCGSAARSVPQPAINTCRSTWVDGRPGTGCGLCRIFA